MITPIVVCTLKTAALMWSLLLATAGCFVFMHAFRSIAIRMDGVDMGHRFVPADSQKPVSVIEQDLS
jgi:hypothetical protein